MADLSSYPDTGDETSDETGVGPDRGSTASTPRWVSVVGIVIAIVLLLLLVGLHLSGALGPGLH